MRKVLFIYFVLFFSFNIKAQMWCPPGATWHYREYMPYIPYFNGNTKVVVTNTVLINSIICNNMVGTFKGISNFPGNPISTLNNFVTFQTHENNKVVYIYNWAYLSFDTIANFNANIGDKWRMIRFPFDTCQNFHPRIQTTVIDTGHVTINNINLKKVKITFQPNQFSATFTVTLIEKIGALSGFLFPFRYNTCWSDQPDYGTFVC